jgi:hypothetical protein
LRLHQEGAVRASRRGGGGGGDQQRRRGLHQHVGQLRRVGHRSRPRQHLRRVHLAAGRGAPRRSRGESSSSSSRSSNRSSNRGAVGDYEARAVARGVDAPPRGPRGGLLWRGADARRPHQARPGGAGGGGDVSGGGGGRGRQHLRTHPQDGHLTGRPSRRRRRRARAAVPQGRQALGRRRRSRSRRRGRRVRAIRRVGARGTSKRRQGINRIHGDWSPPGARAQQPARVRAPGPRREPPRASRGRQPPRRGCQTQAVRAGRRRRRRGGQHSYRYRRG